jgi:hypothetical protein
VKLLNLQILKRTDINRLETKCESASCQLLYLADADAQTLICFLLQILHSWTEANFARLMDGVVYTTFLMFVSGFGLFLSGTRMRTWDTEQWLAKAPDCVVSK